MKNIPLVECWNFVGATPQKFDGEKRYISTGALDKDHINEADVEMVTFDNRPSRANLEVNSGDILFAKMASTEKTFVVDSISQNDIYSTGFCAVRANESKILSKCLYYFLSSSLFLEQKDKNSSGATQKAITNAGLSKIYINLPELAEQQEVIEQMDSLTSLITARREQLAKLDELVKSRFVELFGDYDLSYPQESWIAIKEIGVVVGGATPKTDRDEYWGGTYRWITPAELDADSGYIYDSARKLTKAGVESCSLQEMPIGTVMLSSRAPIGKVAIAGNTFYCNQGFKNIICKETVTPRYLYTVLLLNVDYLNSLGRGATFKEISKGIVENIRIPVPALGIQKQFAAFVEQTDKSKFEIQQSLEKLETLKKALMQKYFG